MNLLSLFRFRAWEFDLSLKYLRTKRKDGGIAVIAIISFVGIMLAVTALISVLSIMNGFREELMSRVLAFGGHGYVYGRTIDDFAHRDDMVARLKAAPGVTSVTPFIDSPGLIQAGNGRTGGGIMRGVVPEDLKNTPIIAGTIAKGGSMDQFGVGDYGGDVVLIGDGLARTVNVIPGDEITLISPGRSTSFGSTPLRKTYIVGGLFHSGVSQIDQSFVYMPIQQAQLFFDREDEWDALEIKVEKPYEVQKYRDAIVKAVGEGGLFEDWTIQNAATWSALKIERAAMRFILFFIVIIATMNIISGVVMLVKNKARDVAILRTMGAGRASITRVFFLTGVMIGGAGTAMGLVLGVLFCTFIRQIQMAIEFIFKVRVFDSNVYYLDFVPAKMELSEVLFVAVASLLASCLSTLFPALWASKLEPVEALRYE
ncbi:lipoprotein releasing system, transmembrane protein, LolC/E family protein [Asticcacaulis biprosthecium C19]|uniref:Lipoprotein releasing system, transmembrane protein, LolC/E family protein n=1 Tax=Asticcacaulis biprosthecium C19 TaxID=715226 RepID=F4QQL0_9CAUL|nr:lipoprotein-releasing ABC transporter permease subunit [Asticcacaulis biprosthecium]EGF90497.1 lipoprotein releasing system, transmembrane protein, LolC/E family protein [Asticcacaulis biprosthecium C19]